MTTPRPRGRPTIPADQRRAEVLRIRFSEAERAVCETAATEAGMELGAWLRTEVLAAAKRAERRRAKGD